MPSFRFRTGSRLLRHQVVAFPTLQTPSMSPSTGARLMESNASRFRMYLCGPKDQGSNTNKPPNKTNKTKTPRPTRNHRKIFRKSPWGLSRHPCQLLLHQGICEVQAVLLGILKLPTRQNRCGFNGAPGSPKASIWFFRALAKMGKNNPVIDSFQ